MASAEASGSSAQLDSSGRSATPMNRNNPAFLNKLRSMLDDKSNEDLIKWAPNGKSFFVPNHIRFGDTLLPRYFKHRNFSSFVRQLNMYGFHKVPHLQQGALDADKAAQSELWEFTNDLFTRDEPELTAQVQRKKATRQANNASGGGAGGAGTGQLENGAGYGAVLLNRLLLTDGASADGQPAAASLLNGAAGSSASGPSAGGPNSSSGSANPQNLHLHPLFPALQAITVAQTNINSELSRLRSSNDDLWREAIDTRQRLKKQQDTVNKVIRFLAGVFGGRALANVSSEDDGVLAAPAAAGVGVGVGAGGKDAAGGTGAASAKSTSRMEAGLGASGAGLGSARRVEVYRPSMTANGRLLIGNGDPIVSDPLDAAAGPSSGRLAGSTHTDDQPRAEIFELPEIEEIHDNDASRFTETVSPSESPPGGSTIKIDSPLLPSTSAKRPSPFPRSGSSARKSITHSATPDVGSDTAGADGIDSSAASNWLASILGQGGGGGADLGAMGSSFGGSGGAAGAGLGSSATQLDAGAMAALQSLFSSTGAGNSTGFASPGGSGVAAGVGGGATGLGTADVPSPSRSTALSLAPNLAGSLAHANFLGSGMGGNAGIWPSSSGGMDSSGLPAGTVAAVPASSNAMVLPYLPDGNGAAAAAAAATQLRASNPELARHSAELGQSADDMQRVNSYLQALIESAMQQQQQQQPQLPGTGTDEAGAAGVPAPGGTAGVNANGAFGGNPFGGGDAAGLGGGPQGSVDLEALLHEFLDPAAAGGSTPSPRPSLGGGAGAKATGGNGRPGGGFAVAQSLALPGMNGVEKESPLWAGEDGDEEDELEEEEEEEEEGAMQTGGLVRKRSDESGSAEPALKRTKAG